MVVAKIDSIDAEAPISGLFSILSIFIFTAIFSYRSKYGHLHTHNVPTEYIIPALANRALNYDISSPSINSRIGSLFNALNEFCNFGIIPLDIIFNFK